jgi:hypothetical protein
MILYLFMFLVFFLILPARPGPLLPQKALTDLAGFEGMAA